MTTKQSFTYLSYPITIWEGSPNSAIPSVQILKMEGLRNGTEMPNWRDLVEKGQNATTVLSASLVSGDNFPGSWSGVEVNGSIKRSCYSNKQGITMSVPNQIASSGLMTRADAEATTKAYKIINRLLSEFSGQAFTGELKETLQLLRHPFEQSLKSIASLSDTALSSTAKKAGKNAKSAAKNVAGSWLEFQFGLMPLLSDIDAILTMANGLVSKNGKMAFRAYGSAEDSTVSSTTSMLDVYGYNQTVETTLSSKAECIIHFGLSRQFIDKANAYKTDWTSSFTDLAQLPATAWELLPWSWLADYVVNISDIIQAATTATGGVTYISKSKILTIARRDVGTTLSTVASRFSITSNVPRVFSCKKRTVERTGTPLGIPSVVFSLPGSNIRYLNIAAVVTQLLANLRRS